MQIHWVTRKNKDLLFIKKSLCHNLQKKFPSDSKCLTLSYGLNEQEGWLSPTERVSAA